jgi:hypothetical protein
VCDQLAQKAANQATSFRRSFGDPVGCANYYEGMEALAPNAFFDAGMACGLARRVPHAERWFQRCLEIDDDRPFVVAEKRRAREPLAFLAHEAAFTDQVRGSIARTRRRYACLCWLIGRSDRLPLSDRMAVVLAVPKDYDHLVLAAPEMKPAVYWEAQRALA